MIKTLLAAALATGLGVSSAMAVPFAASPLGDAADANVVDVHFTGDGHHLHHRRAYRGRHYYPRHRYRPRSGVSVELRFGSPGYRHTPRYRHAPRYRHGYTANYGARHHAWCEGKYRSYSRHSGTYQPYHGPRRRCNSPYDGI